MREINISSKMKISELQLYVGADRVLTNLAEILHEDKTDVEKWLSSLTVYQVVGLGCVDNRPFALITLNKDSSSPHEQFFDEVILSYAKCGKYTPLIFGGTVEIDDEELNDISLDMWTMFNECLQEKFDKASRIFRKDL